MDECSDEEIDNFCPTPGSCTNLAGGFDCVCPTAYRVTPSGCEGLPLSLHSCITLVKPSTLLSILHTCITDKNECELGTHDCDLSPGRHYECLNTDSGYECSCQTGYALTNSSDCANVDECADPDSNDCDINADCFDEDGSYECTCKEGFRGNGFQCTGRGE